MRKKDSIDVDSEEVEIELPLVKLTKSDVLGALFVHTDNAKELYKDALLRLQTWIVNLAEEQVRPLVESEKFTEEEIEKFKQKYKVISPITLALYLHSLQMDDFAKLPYSQKEKLFLERIPDRFKARYRGNAACRNAREVAPEEEAAKEDATMEEDNGIERKRYVSCLEFLKEFGAEIRKELGSLEKKE